MPHIQVANVILINKSIFSFLLYAAFLNGIQKRKTIPPKMPACTNLSKSIEASHGASGRSSPGKHTRISANKNQAMPGKNFENPGSLKEELLFKSIV